MCGRYAFTKAKDELIKAQFKILQIAVALKPRYNIAPTQDIYTILNDDPETLTTTRWGLIPSWAKDPAIGNRMINARAEGIEKKPSFRVPIRKKRCLILADSFYEWKKGPDAKKRPFRIMLKDERLFAFAGIWDTWEHAGKTLVTSSIITTEANELVSGIHDRMPVILRTDQQDDWLRADLAGALQLLKPYEAADMAAYEVSTLVNAPANDVPEVMDAL